MDIWKVLEIEKTKDKKQIKTAYRNKLIQCNPEENQKAFMELRQAYDEAMRFSDTDDENGEGANSGNGRIVKHQWDDTPVGKWMAKVDEIYRDMKRRRNQEEWERLLDDEVCVALDTQVLARNELLKYLMEYNHLPQKIWILLDRKFMLMEYKEELYETFPQNYIDRGVIENIKYKDFVDMERLESLGGEDYDEYIRLCNRAYSQISDGDILEALENINKMEKLQIYHPYQDLCIARCHLVKEEYEKAEKMLCFLVQKYPDDIHILKSHAVLLVKKKHYDEAIYDYKKILKMEPKYYDVYLELGAVYFLIEDYENAKEVFDAAYDMHKSNYVQEQIDQCIDELYKIHQKKYYENPADIENCIEYARNMYQKSETEAAIDFLEKVTPDPENRLEYAHILGCCYMFREEYEKAYPLIEEWVRKTEQLTDDGTEKTRKAMRRLVYAYIYLGYTVDQLFDDAEKSREYVDKAIATGINTIDVYEFMARIAYQRKQYEYVMTVCDEIQEFDNNSMAAYAFRAQALYEMGYVRDAVTQIDRCMELEPYDLSLHLKKIEYCIDLAEYEKVEEMLRYLEENGVKNDKLSLLKERCRWKNGDYEEANHNLFELAFGLLKKEDEKKDDNRRKLLSMIHYEMAAISLYKEQDVEKAKYNVDKSLSENSENVMALYLKAFILYKEDDWKKSLDLFKKVVEVKPYHLTAYGYIGEIYEKNHLFEAAIQYYTKQIDVAENAYMYLSRGWCYAALYRFNEARKDYEKSIEYDERPVSAYRNLGNTYLYDEMEEKAIEMYEQAIKNDSEITEPFIYKNICDAYMRLGKHKEAVEAMKQYIQIDKNPKHIEGLAMIFMDLGDYENALKEFYRYAGYKEHRYQNIEKICECIFMSGRVSDASFLVKEAKEALANVSTRDSIDRWSVEVSSVFIRMQKKKYLGMKHEMGALIKYYTKYDIGKGDEVILIRFLMELRHHHYRKIKYHIPLMMEVTNKLKMEIDHTNVTCRNETRILCENAVLSMEYGNLEQAMEYVNQALSSKKCHTCHYFKCGKAFFIKAVIFELMGRKEEAFGYYEQAAKTDGSAIMFHTEYLRMKLNS